VIKRSARYVDAAQVRTAEYPAAPPPPLPLLPTTAGWRWPWLVGTLAIASTAVVLLLPALEMGFQLGTSDDEQYTSWVATPRVEAYFAVIAVSLATFGLLCFRRWKHRTRNVMFAVCALLCVACASSGIHESSARRHIGPALAAAVKAVPRPPGATSSGPVVVGTDSVPSYLDLLGEPSARQEWDPATDTEAAACADARAMVAGHGGWQQSGICGFSRSQGRVLVIIDVGTILNANSINVTAYPND
jgi:hypothetical protein